MKKISLQLICLSILFLLANITRAQEPYQVRMAMVGNSITFGSGLANPAQECYPTQLNNLLSAVYGDTVIIENYGVSGRTMLKNTDKSIWGEFKFRTALEFVPDICLILLGTNDSRPDYWDPYGDEFLDDYLAMIDTFKFRNPYTKFIICTPPPVFPGAAYDHENETIVSEIIPAIETVAATTGATLVDFHNAFLDSIHLFPDKLHPNVEGAGIMANILYDLMVDSSMIDQVETGLAFVSTFKQYPVIAPVGNTIELNWTTLFADSVFLDGELVELSGSVDVVAEADRVYTLTAKGPNNTSSFPLMLNTYVVNATSDIQANNEVRVYPNPAGETLYLQIDKPKANQIKIEVYNVLGEQVLRPVIQKVSPGTNTFELNINNLSPGTYFYSITIDTETRNGQFIKQTLQK